MNKCKLGKLLKVKHGFAFKSENYVEKSEYALVTLANISSTNDFQYNEEKTTYYGASFPSEFILKTGDLIMPLTEQVMGLFGNSAFVPYIKHTTFVLNQRVGKVLVDEEKADKFFIHYLLSTDSVRNQLEYRASGTRQRNISPEDVYDVEVFVPDLEEQRRIGKLLYALEQRVYNNNCINDNLQQVIKSCFDFMFATRKPNGIISDILQEHPKSTIQVNDSTGILGNYPFFTSGEAINEWQSALVDGMNCYLSTGGNATIKGYYGKAAYSTDTWCVCGKGEYSFYLFCYLKSIIRSINDSFFAGSGLKHLQKDSLLLVNLYIPSEKELEKFNSIVKPAMETMTKLFLETKKLKQQRDFLLPLLMNGQATIAE